jgi:hypothetical protein
MYLQSIKSVKHNATKFVSRSILKKSRHIGPGVFIFHLSMYLVLVYNCSEGGIPVVAQVGGQAVEPVGEGSHHWREDEGPRSESTNHEAAS